MRKKQNKQQTFWLRSDRNLSTQIQLRTAMQRPLGNLVAWKAWRGK